MHKICIKLYFIILQVNQFTVFFGTSGVVDYRKVCYGIVDKIFDRVLLDGYTWTGVSRTGSKKSFSNFKNVNDFFFQIVLAADKSYTIDLQVKFFMETILRHSKQRLQHHVRKSAPRFRPSKKADFSTEQPETSTSTA